jgi:hypothetical protein
MYFDSKADDVSTPLKVTVPEFPKLTPLIVTLLPGTPSTELTELITGAVATVN